VAAVGEVTHLRRSERLGAGDESVAVLAVELARCLDAEVARHSEGGPAYTVDRLARAYLACLRELRERTAVDVEPDRLDELLADMRLALEGPEPLEVLTVEATG
jgi:hypothetical protein